jgi:putative ABC transport system permease protein
MLFFLRQIFRYARRHKLLALINVVSIGLGVAVFLAVQIANRSAIGAFEAGVDLVAGRAHLEARGNFPDQTWPKLRTVRGVIAATPLVERTVTLPDFPGEYLHIVGLDPFTNGPFETLKVKNWNAETAAETWFGRPDSIVVAQSFAERYHLKPGDHIRASFAEKTADLQIGSILEAGDVDLHLAAMDVGWAQELFGMAGQLTAVLFRVSDPKDSDPVREEIGKIVPGDVAVQAPDQRSTQVAKMLAGFQLNLTALSLVSLLVGLFLVYNTVTASAVRRQHEIGIMRSVGMTRAQVQWIFLGEAALYGTAGSILGCLGGIVLSNSLVKIVSKTVTNLYILTSIEHFQVPLWEVPLVFILGIGTALVGAWVPARNAGYLPPLQALNIGLAPTKASRSDLWSVFLSLVSAALAYGTGIAALAGYRPAGFAAAFFTLAFACFLAPNVTALLGKLIERLGVLPRLVRLTGSNFNRSVHRHAVAVAAVAAAVAMLVSVSVMINSFRVTVTRWVNRRLVADIFLSPASNEIVGFENFLSPAVISFVRTLPGVASLDFYRDQAVRCNGEPTSMGVIVGSKQNAPDFVGGNNREKYSQFYDKDTIIVSEPLARKMGLKEGGQAVLTTPVGERRFRIAGVFYDYTRDAGLILMQAANFERYWHDDRVNSMAIYLQPNTSVGNTINAIRTHYPEAGSYAVRSNRDLRTLVSEIFNQTFAITYILRLVALVVAAGGITLNLIVLIKERQRENGVLRSIGLSRFGLGLLVVGEAGLVGVSALIVGILGGVGLAFVLTEVINKAFFGWTIPLSWPVGELLLIPLIILPVAFLAGLFPAWQSARTPIIEVIRD